MYILDKLWMEGLSPNERYTRKGGEYHKTLLRLCEEEDRIREELSEEGKEHFEAYQQAHIDLSSIADKEVFIEAVRLGARLMLDILGDFRGNFCSATDE